MSRDLSQITILGNVGKTEVKTTQKGDPMLTFSVAVNDDKSDTPTWFGCILLGKRAEAVGAFLEKSMRVLVIGAFKLEAYEKDGQQRQAAKVLVNTIEVTSSKGERGASSMGVQTPMTAEIARRAAVPVGKRAPEATFKPPAGYNDTDEIPF